MADKLGEIIKCMLNHIIGTFKCNESYSVNDACDGYIHEYDDCIKVKFYCLGGGKYGKVIGIYKKKN